MADLSARVPARAGFPTRQGYWHRIQSDVMAITKKRFGHALPQEGGWAHARLQTTRLIGRGSSLNYFSFSAGARILAFGGAEEFGPSLAAVAYPLRAGLSEISAGSRGVER